MRDTLIGMFFDAHAHAQFAAFDQDRKEVIDRALVRGVSMINVGTQRDTSRRAVEVANRYPEGIYASVGLHPIHTEKSFHDTVELDTFFGSANAEEEGRPVFSARAFTSRGEEFDSSYYRNLANDPKVVAIGECGLDYYRLGSKTKHKQMRAFEQQIQLAKEVNKPLMIHCRSAFSAFDDLIQILNHHLNPLRSDSPGVIHLFTGTKENARSLLDLGFSMTFGGVITFLRDYDEIIKMIPLDRIMSETDSPYATPAPYRGRRNEPAFIIEVVRKLAEIKRLSVEEMQETVWENARRVFGLSVRATSEHETSDR